MSRGAIVSSSTLRWAHYIGGSQGSYAGYNQFDFSANLLALDCLVDAIVYFDVLTACAQAGALQHTLPLDVKLIDVNAEIADLELRDLYYQSRELNRGLYGAVVGREWYEIMSSGRAPEESEAWRDGIATELGAAMVLGAKRSLPILLNGLEASVVDSMLSARPAPERGRCFFNDALQLAQTPDEILHAARTLRVRPEAREWREGLTLHVGSRASPVPDKGNARVHVFAAGEGRGTAVCIEPVINYSRVGELFRASGSAIEEQVEHFLQWARR